MAHYYSIIEDADIVELIAAQLIHEGTSFSCDLIEKETYKLSLYCEKGIDILEGAGYTVYVEPTH